LRRVLVLFTLLISLIIIGINTPFQAKANHSIDKVAELDDHTKRVILDDYIEILIEEGEEYTLEDIVTGKYDDDFFTFTGKGRPNFGYNLSFYWIRFELQNHSMINNWLLEIDAPKLNNITLYLFDDGINDYEPIKLGNWYSFSEREVKHRNFVTPIEINPQENKTIYLRLKTGSSVQIPLTLWNYADFHSKSLIEYTIFGALFGLSVVMALYNLFLYFSIRDMSYLYYVLFVLLNTLLYLTDTGLIYQYLFPDGSIYNTPNVTHLMFLVNISGLLFVRSFLSLKERSATLERLFKFLIAFNAIAFIIRLITFTASVYIATALVILSIILILFSSGYSLRKGYRPASFLLIAWGLFLLGVFISLMVDVGLIPLTVTTKYSWQITTMFEVVLLSLALGDKYKTFREEKEAAIQELNKTQQDALKNLRRTDKLKDEFLTMTSHELKTPLNGIIGIADTMRAGAAGKLSKQMDDHLSMIVSSGKRLSHLINDILDYSHLKNDQLKMNFQPIRLYEITNVVLTLCQPLLKNKSIQLINNINAEEHLIVYADETRVQQILYNLIGNAIKYTIDGVVTVSASVKNNFIKINVTDTGKGISEEQQRLIFDQFFQVEDSDRREFDGSGIGLNITKRLVDKHGGELTVDSIIGVGSTFSFTLPKYVGEAETKEVSAAIETFADYETLPTITHSIAQMQTEGKAKVLVTDDDPINLQVLMNQLHLADYEVITATSGFEVLEIVQRETFDLLILDVMMPQMSGYDVCKLLRKKFSLLDLPILMLTAKAQLQDKIVAFEVGANDYLSKPCDRKELLARVHTLIQLSRLNRELKRINVVLEDKVKQRTEQLQAANFSLEKTIESRTHLLSSIAHDLGTPVTVVYNYLQAIDKGIIEDAEKGEFLQLAYSKINVLNRLISDLFDLSRLEAQQLQFNIHQIDVKHWISDLKKKLALELIQTDRQITYTIGQIADIYICYIDEQRMDQVFSNLIWNAVNHTSQTDGTLTIHVELDNTNGEIVFQFKDNGSGIDPDMLPFIFDRYYKIESLTEERRGTGVGLAIVKEIVQVHEGRVWVESEPGVGSSFYVALPVREKTDEQVV